MGTKGTKMSQAMFKQILPRSIMRKLIQNVALKLRKINDKILVTTEGLLCANKGLIGHNKFIRSEPTLSRDGGLSKTPPFS